MRFLYLFFFLILTSNGIAQNNFKFDESNYQTSIQKSKTEKKPLLLMIYATWCPHCEKMKNEVLNDTSVIDLLSKNYICNRLDSDSEEGKMVKAKFKTTSLPTFIILDSDETELYRLKGEYKTQSFITELKNAMNPKQQLPYLEKNFLADPSNVQNWLSYMNVLKKGREREYLAEKAKPYFATQTDAQLISETNWLIISNCVTDIPSREFQLLLQHKKEFEALSSPARVERKINSIVTELLKPYTQNLDTISYYKQRKIAKTIPSQKVDSLIFRYDLLITERTNNWNEYRKVTIESTEKFAWNDISLLKEIGNNYLKNITDKPSLKQAIKWMNHCLELNNSYDGNVILSYLYLKINDKKSAIAAAKKARAICTELKFNPKVVDELYLKLGIK
ncbi:MAG TPA: thioredoxin family protein [Flavobacterium sp.]